MELSGDSAATVSGPKESQVVPTEHPATSAGTSTARANTGAQRVAADKPTFMASAAEDTRNNGRQPSSGAVRDALQRCARGWRRKGNDRLHRASSRRHNRTLGRRAETEETR